MSAAAGNQHAAGLQSGKSYGTRAHYRIMLHVLLKLLFTGARCT